MDRRAAWDRIRRVLLFASGPAQRAVSSDVQLDLPLLAPPPFEPIDDRLHEHSQRLHDLHLELVLLVQMEAADLIESPLAGKGRLRLGLGSDPPLRLLEEWERTAPIEPHAWMLGQPRADRERAWLDSLGRARFLAEACGLTAGRVREVVRRLYPLAARASAIDDLPGLIAAHGRRHLFARNPSGRLVFRIDPDRRRSGGAVHTPPEPAAELLRILWEAGGFVAMPQVLDPACGSGQFLLAAAEYALPPAAGEFDATTLGQLRRLYGVDIDPSAARLAAWNLSYWAACRLRDARREGNGNARRPAEAGRILDELFGPQFPYLLGSSIQVGNALQVEPSSFSPGFRWEKRFPESFQRHPSGFDLVIGNPPWISYGLRDRGRAPDEERDYYERLFPAGTQYKLTLYPIFMELALRLCREGACTASSCPTRSSPGITSRGSGGCC